MDCSQDSVIVTANSLELCKIWYHLCKLKKVKNTHGGVLLLVKLQGPAFFFFFFQKKIKYFFKQSKKSWHYEFIFFTYSFSIQRSYKFSEFRGKKERLKLRVKFTKPLKRQTHKTVKHTQTMRRQQPTNCLSVFDHFAGWRLKG